MTHEIKAKDVYKDFCNDKDKFDNSDYPECSLYYDKTNKKVVGKLKNETCGISIIEFIGLRSKMYSYMKEYHEINKVSLRFLIKYIYYMMELVAIHMDNKIFMMRWYNSLAVIISRTFHEKSQCITSCR